MNISSRMLVVTGLVEDLNSNGSWCGETHVQKACYFLQEAEGVPLDYRFTLYKHGPFSFDLRKEITELRSSSVLVMQPQSYPYGPSLDATNLGRELLTKRDVDSSLSTWREAAEHVASFLGASGVSTLEQLSTALYVIKELGDKTSDDDLVVRIVHYKPHVSTAQASKAVADVRTFLSQI